MPALILCREAARDHVGRLRLLFALFALLPLLLTTPALSAERPLVLETFFRGTTTGQGVFRSDIAGIERRFTVVTRGHLNPKTFTLRLREDFRFADGERDTKVWFFQKVAADRYIATRSDVLTPVNITSGGPVLRFDYPATVETADGPVALRFFDTLRKIDSRTVRNTADVMKYGIVVGKVEVTFRK